MNEQEWQPNMICLNVNKKKKNDKKLCWIFSSINIKLAAHFKLVFHVHNKLMQNLFHI